VGASDSALFACGGNFDFIMGLLSTAQTGQIIRMGIPDVILVVVYIIPHQCDKIDWFLLWYWFLKKIWRYRNSHSQSFPIPENENMMCIVISIKLHLVSVPDM